MDGKHLQPTPGFKRSVCVAAALLSFLPVSASSAATPNSEFVQAIYRGEATPQRNGMATAADPDIERRFNDLRREFLDDRSKQVDWWLAATAIFLTLISVLGVLGGYFGFRRFHEIEAEVRENANKVRENAEKSRQYTSAAQANLEQVKNIRDTARSMFGDMTAEIVEEEPDKSRDIAQKVSENPEATEIDKAVSAAIVLQDERKIDQAIKKWHAITDILEGGGSDLEYRAWFSIGYLYHKSDPPDIEAAIHAYGKAINIDPTRVEAYSNRGGSKASLGLYDEAIADYDKAIQLEPDFATAYFNRGNAKNSLGLYDKAISDYDKAIQLNPNFASAYFNRGGANESLGRHEEAIADYDKAIQLNPDLFDAHVNRGLAKVRLGRFRDAIADYDSAIKINPDYAEAYCNRGHAKGCLARYDEAIKDYDQAIQLNPDFAEAYNSRGIANMYLRRYEDAIADCNQAIRLKADFAEAYASRGNANAGLRRYQDAVADYDRAIRINRNYAEAYHNRGVAKYRQGLALEARADFETGLALAREANNDDLAKRAERCLNRYRDR